MEEQQKNETETKYFHVENVGKNIITTVIGCILMGMSTTALVLQWFFARTIPASNTALAVVFAIGFMLLFMRDKVQTYLDIFTRKKIDAEK